MTSSYMLAHSFIYFFSSFLVYIRVSHNLILIISTVCYDEALQTEPPASEKAAGPLE